MTPKFQMLCAPGLLAVLCQVVLAGCATIEGRRTTDGTLTIRSTRLLWSTQNLVFSVNDGTNIVVTLRASRTGTDTEAIAAITEAAARGAVKAATHP